MSTFMMVWNPKLWGGDPEFWHRRLRLSAVVSAPWDTGKRQSGISPDDRIFLVKTGEPPLGVLASGRVSSEIWPGPPHLGQDQEGPDVMYVDVEWDSATSKSGVLSRQFLMETIPENGWTFQLSGIRLDDDVAARLEGLWAAHPPVQYGRPRSEAWFEDLVQAARGPEPELEEGWRPGRLGATTPQAVDRLRLAPGAPESLALLGMVLARADIGADWTLSCLPTGALYGRRAFTLSRGLDEVMYCGLHDDGYFNDWSVIIDSSGEEAARRLGFEPFATADHGTFITHTDPWALVAALNDSALSDAVVSALRSSDYRGAVRQTNRHNDALASVIDDIVALVPPADGGMDDADEGMIADEVVRAYRTYEAKRRLHQAKFRALLLTHHPAECAVCGLDRIEVLEAAHLVPDALGGAASVSNGRILCANHHRALDAKLLRIEDGSLHWVDGTTPF